MSNNESQMLNNKDFDLLFSEISEDLAEAINGGLAHNCHKTSFTDRLDKLALDI